MENEKIIAKKWGYEKEIYNEKYCIKELHVDYGKRSSLHWHKKKDETFYMLKGKILLENETGGLIKEKIMVPGDYQRVKPNTNHRFNGLEDSVILECSTHHEDSDSYRVEGQLSGDMPEELKRRLKMN